LDSGKHAGVYQLGKDRENARKKDIIRVYVQARCQCSRL
jgi:hypothetical protein